MKEESCLKVVVGQVKPDVKKRMSYRQAVSRYLPLEKSVTVIKQGSTAPSSLGSAFVRNIGADTALYSGQKLSRMTSAVQAFTLIELLVVVLIIGILAAVALPQYQKAVWRSRNTQLKTLVKSVGQAREAYYMANGSYPSNFDEMNIDLPLTRAFGATPYFTTAGEDSVRRENDFLIGISTGDYSLYGLWTSGPYEGAGFYIADDDILKCAERRGHYGGVTNKFCVSLERGTNKQISGYFNIYDLP